MHRGGYKLVFVIKKSHLLICIGIFAVLGIAYACKTHADPVAMHTMTAGSYIKWVDFDITNPAMERALQYDISSFGTTPKINWLDILGYLGAKYGGDFSKYKAKDMDNFVSERRKGKTVEDLTEKMSSFGYYREAYGAVLEGFVGEFQIEVPGKENPDEKVLETRYGLKVFSPIAKGFYFSHSDDFGNSRSYGFKRKHLGNDLVSSTGTPVIAVESGIVEALGWNQYGGWRIGIRSFDKRRYYYYAHLRKNYPYHKDLYAGKTVKAGDVIGYVGRSGYSSSENVNNIQTPHLHFGMQIIFDESQKDGNNEIWINVYEIVKLLQKNKSAVVKDENTKEYTRVYDITIFPSIND